MFLTSQKETKQNKTKLTPSPKRGLMNNHTETMERYFFNYMADRTRWEENLPWLLLMAYLGFTSEKGKHLKRWEEFLTTLQTAVSSQYPGPELGNYQQHTRESFFVLCSYP